GAIEPSWDSHPPVRDRAHPPCDRVTHRFLVGTDLRSLRHERADRTTFPLRDGSTNRPSSTQNALHGSRPEESPCAGRAPRPTRSSRGGRRRPRDSRSSIGAPRGESLSGSDHYCSFTWRTRLNITSSPRVPSATNTIEPSFLTVRPSSPWSSEARRSSLS